MGSVTVTGTVLEVEHKQGEYNGIAYDFKVAHVLTGRKVVEVRFNPDNGDARPPAQDAEVTIEVEVPQKVRLTAKRYTAADKPVRAAG